LQLPAQCTAGFSGESSNVGPRRTRRTGRRPQHAVPAQSAETNDRPAQLRKLGKLLSAGVLTRVEFEQQKQQILNG
jgi:hypothetical protein